MRITPDTNILVRFHVGDDAVQAFVARKALQEATLIALTIPTLCEFVWVVRHLYKLTREETSGAIHELLNSDKVVVDWLAVSAGLAVLEAGGDFADGVIAYEGRVLGGEVFVSFERKAVSLVSARGGRAMRLG